eukprot:4184936-Pyramimonas_sp.AAC.1
MSTSENIKSGHHGKSLAKKWEELPDSEKLRCRIIAQGVRAEAAAAERQRQQGQQGRQPSKGAGSSSESSLQTAWGIGSRECPLRRELGFEKITGRDAADHSMWKESLKLIAENTCRISSKKVTYNKVCSEVGYCVSENDDISDEIEGVLAKWRE